VADRAGERARALDADAPGSRWRSKLIESAQHRRRAANFAHLIALISAAAKFENAIPVE
jgi:hypothetical protein